MQEAERVMLETLAALSNAGPATEGVLNRSDVAMGALDAAAASDKAVGSGADPLGLGRAGGGTLRPGEQGGGLGGLANTGRSGGTEGSGAGAKVAGPKAAMPGVSSSTSAATSRNAARVVAAMRAAFRACYQKGLDVKSGRAGQRSPLHQGRSRWRSDERHGSSIGKPPAVGRRLHQRSRTPRAVRSPGGWSGCRERTGEPG